MKLKDLIKKLHELESQDSEVLEYEVIMSKDGEGNNFSPLSDFSESIYIPDSTWSGDVINQQDAEEFGLDKDTKPNCIVLWPVN